MQPASVTARESVLPKACRFHVFAMIIHPDDAEPALPPPGTRSLKSGITSHLAREHFRGKRRTTEEAALYYFRLGSRYGLSAVQGIAAATPTPSRLNSLKLTRTFSAFSVMDQC